MCVFFGGIIQGFGGFRHSPIPTKTHTDKAILSSLAGVLNNILYRVGLRG